jgi:hypothetical protein
MPHWLDKVIELLLAPTANLRELAHLAGRDPENFYLGVDVGKLELEGQDISGLNFSPRESAVHAPSSSFWTLDRVHTIKAARRQEERLVLLLDEIIKDRSSGADLLRLYAADKAKYATLALQKLIFALDSEASGAKKITNTQLIKKATSHFAKSPTRRTTLNYFMYKHLRKYPDLKDWISAKSISRLYLTPGHWDDLKRIYEIERANKIARDLLQEMHQIK